MNDKSLSCYTRNGTVSQRETKQKIDTYDKDAQEIYSYSSLIYAQKMQ